MKPRDLDALLRRVARQPDGSYRELASKALEGKPAGHFRYYGTRPDDPNDIFRTSTGGSSAGWRSSPRG